MEIQEQGRLHVEGSNAQKPGGAFYDVGGGAGGVIQVISSEGSLAAGTSFLKPGYNVGLCFNGAEHGYVFVLGEAIYTCHTQVNPTSCFTISFQPYTRNQICYILMQSFHKINP